MIQGVINTTIEQAKAKLVATARGELGYHEGGNNYTKYSDDPNITQLYGWTPQNQPWCCTFVNWCFMAAFGYDIGSRLTYGGSAACANSASLFRAHNAFVTTPEVGDQAFYYSGGGINHTGLVVEVSGGSFVAIEGNYSDKVSSVTHRISGSDIAGFGRPNWELISEKTDDELPKTTQNSTNSEFIAQKNEDHSWKPSLLRYSNSYSSDCVVLQSLLNAHHFACGSADGFFGAKTQAAVNKAQQFYGLTVDGVCGQQTWKKLLEI